MAKKVRGAAEYKQTRRAAIAQGITMGKEMNDATEQEKTEEKRWNWKRKRKVNHRRANS